MCTMASEKKANENNVEIINVNRQKPVSKRVVANFVSNFSSPSRWTAESSYRGVRNFTNNKMGITVSALKELRSHLSFTQLRFHCSKKQGRTFRVTTVSNSTGEAVIEYFSGQTDVHPDSCGSFQRMEDDNSKLAMECESFSSGDFWKIYVR